MKSVSLMTVIVQVSKVLSPATFKIRPLKGISTGAIVEEGRAAALTKNLDFCKTSFSLTGATDVGNAKTTSKRLGLAPPPVNLDLKSLQSRFQLFGCPEFGYFPAGGQCQPSH